MDIGRIVAAQLVRFIAASQATPALVLHGAWMLLAIATWQASDPSADVTAITRSLVRAFHWLGGVGPDGHADEGNLAQAMVLLTLPFYLLASLRHRIGGPRASVVRRTLVWATLSGGVAFAGFARGMWAGGGLTAGELGWMALFLALVTAVVTGWAVLMDWLGDLVVERIEAVPRP